MAGRFGRHIRSNVVGYIALFFALSLGTAWAATELDRNEVKSKHIGKGQVKAADLAKNSVTSPKVADGSLLDEDFAPGQLPQGPQGERGPEGPPGQPGADATNLFGYISDDGGDNAATVRYGNGVTGVVDPTPGEGSYFVDFNRSLANCVVHVQPGSGNPNESGTSFNVLARVNLVTGSAPGDVMITVLQHNGALTDNSFMISAFC